MSPRTTAAGVTDDDDDDDKDDSLNDDDGDELDNDELELDYDVPDMLSDHSYMISEAEEAEREYVEDDDEDDDVGLLLDSQAGGVWRTSYRPTLYCLHLFRASVLAGEYREQTLDGR